MVHAYVGTVHSTVLTTLNCTFHCRFAHYYVATPLILKDLSRGVYDAMPSQKQQAGQAEY